MTQLFGLDPFQEEKELAEGHRLSSTRFFQRPGGACVKVSVLGSPGVGKSALVLRFCKADFLTFYEPTIQEEFEKTVSLFGSEVLVSVLDTAGQEDFMPMRSQWVEGRDAFVLAFDATRPELFALNE